MQNNADLTLKQLITEINVLLNELKNEQLEITKNIEKNHKVNMQKFSKLLEYDKICDMTNTLFERRLASIEKLLYEVFKS